MPVANVTTEWVSGNLVFYDKSKNIIATWDGTNRKLSLPSGSTLESLGTTTITDATLSPNDLALAEGSVLVGDSAGKAVALVAKTDTAILIGNGTTAVAKTISGDASLANTGALTISAKAVENTMIAAAAGTVLVGTKTSGDVTALDISAKGAFPVGQGAGETAAAKTMSGDVAMSETGAVTIQAKAVENTMIAAAAGTVLVGTKTSGDVTALDISAKGAIPVGQGAGETAAAKTMSGDVSMDETGAVTIAAKAVESTMIAAAAGTVLIGTKTSGDVTALDISAEGAMALGQGAGETAVAHAMTGDVTMTKGGVTAIGAAKVTSAMLANGAGVAALLTAGLGGSVSVVKTDAKTDTVVAAHGSKDRACLVLVTVDETYDIGTGTLPTVEVGETDTIDKCMAHTVLDTEAAGTVLAFAFTNTATKAVLVTSTAAVGNATGGCSVTVLAIPTT